MVLERESDARVLGSRMSWGKWSAPLSLHLICHVGLWPGNCRSHSTTVPLATEWGHGAGLQHPPLPRGVQGTENWLHCGKRALVPSQDPHHHSPDVPQLGQRHPRGPAPVP